MSLRSILFAGLIALAPGAAQAQYQMISPMLYHGPRIALENHVQQQKAGREEARRNPPAPPRPTVDTASLIYTVDAGRRRANLAGFVAKTRTTDPAGADSMARLFATTDVFGAIQAEGRRYGLRVDNLADAYAAYWINAWQATQGITADPSRAAMTAVSGQAGRALRESLGQAGDPVKQEMAESLWIQAMLVAGATDAAKGKPDEERAVADAVAQGARGMGLDLRAMRLTDQGFIPR